MKLTVSGPGGSDTFVLADAIEVEPGPAFDVRILPPDDPIVVGRTTLFSAAVMDEFDNRISNTVDWEVDPAVGVISPEGMFTPSTIASTYLQAITASITDEPNGPITSSADVVISPGPLSEVNLAPALISIAVTGSQLFSVEALDDYGNQVTEFVSAWSTSPVVGSVSGTGEYKASTTAGNYPAGLAVEIVQGSIKISASADITLAPGAIERIAIFPESVDVDKNGTQQFSATAKDRYENVHTNIEFAWTSSGGMITGDGEFIANGEAGRHEVRASAFAGEQISGVATADVASIVWDLSKGTFGWTGNNQAQNLRSTTEGLAFDSIGGDPWVWSPLVQNIGGIDPVIKIRMKSNASSGHHDLFWGPSHGNYQSTTGEVIADGAWHEIEIQISQQLDYGVLRWDAANMPGEITIAWIKVIPNPSKVTMSEAAPSFVTKWGSEGDGAGQFDNATRVATDSSGNVYVTSNADHKILKFSAQGDFLATWGTSGSGNG
ncbi:MAG: hypothetical protein O3B95_00325 [Chloroflexi bacterium]|nr:hypothetical protein [Chloroflexota bacterium]